MMREKPDWSVFKRVWKDILWIHKDRKQGILLYKWSRNGWIAGGRNGHQEIFLNWVLSRYQDIFRWWEWSSKKIHIEHLSLPLFPTPGTDMKNKLVFIDEVRSLFRPNSEWAVWQNSCMKATISKWLHPNCWIKSHANPALEYPFLFSPVQKLLSWECIPFKMLAFFEDFVF